MLKTKTRTGEERNERELRIKTKEKEQREREAGRDFVSLFVPTEAKLNLYNWIILLSIAYFFIENKISALN